MSNNFNKSYATTEEFGKHEQISEFTPQFTARRAAGEIIPSTNHFNDKREFFTPTSQALTGAGWNPANHPQTAATGFNAKVGVLGVGDTELERCFDDISTRLDTKVRNTTLDLGVAIGESRETAEFIYQAITRSWKSYRHLRKGRVSKAVETLTGRKNLSWRDIPGVASNTWLAYVFGFRPLANDVYDAVKLLEDGFRGQNKVHVAKTNFRREWDDRIFSDFSAVGNTHFIEENARGFLTCSGKIFYEIDDADTANLDQLGLLNPAAVVWEVVPFSFVVDWFLPIGKYITSIVPPQGVTFKSGYTLVKGKGGCDSRDFRDNPEPPLRHHDLRMTSKESFKERRMLSDFADPQVRVPDLKFSQERIATAMALIWSVVIEGRGDPRKFRLKRGL